MHARALTHAIVTSTGATLRLSRAQRQVQGPDTEGGTAYVDNDPTDAKEALERDLARGELLVDAELFIVLLFPDGSGETWRNGWYRHIAVKLDGGSLEAQLEAFVRSGVRDDLVSDLREAGYVGPDSSDEVPIAWVVDPQLANVARDVLGRG